MSIVDLAKARAFADVVAESEAEAADWIRELADEVASQDRALTELRAMVADVEAEAAKTQDERDAALAALRELYARVGSMIKDLK